jgi:phosphoglycolate phosphatase-like HAD superfamily hydrolase
MSKNNEFEQQKAIHKRKNTVVFDLDGTLAMTDDPKARHKINHPKFAREAATAECNDKILDKMKKARDNGENVVILTARSAHYREVTKRWLHENNVPYDALVMRPTDNITSDKKVKKELLEEDILPKFDVKKAYDDKKKNVKMFDKLGIDGERVK